jgi:cell division protein FtsL
MKSKKLNPNNPIEIIKYIEELEDKIDELEHENNDLQYQIDELNNRD